MTTQAAHFNLRAVGLFAFTGALGGVSVGYNCGIVAGMCLYIEAVFPVPVTLADQSNIVSMAVLGATLGAMIAGNIGEVIGRKKSIIVADLLAIAGPAIQYFGQTVMVLCMGRLILGFGMGISMMISQVYMSESTPIALRGQVVPSYAIYIIFICLELLTLSSNRYFFGVFFSFILAHTSSVVFAYNLPLMFVLGALPNALQLLLMLFTQSESPSYLSMRGDYQSAIPVVDRFYKLQPVHQPTTDQRELHLQEVKEAGSGDKQISQRQLYGELFSRYGWNLYVGFMLHVIQQFTGINIILYYGPAIIIKPNIIEISYFHIPYTLDLERVCGMRDAGFGAEEGSATGLLYSMIFLSVVNTVGNFIGLVISGKYGRRELMLKVTPPMGAALLILTGAMVANSMIGGGSKVTGFLCILCLAAYLLLFTIGFASQPWTICSEIFPSHLKALANSITATTNWLFNYLLSAVFLVATATPVGKVCSYMVLGLSCFFAYYFTKWYVPETKDRSLDESPKPLLIKSLHRNLNEFDINLPKPSRQKNYKKCQFNFSNSIKTSIYIKIAPNYKVKCRLVMIVISFCKYECLSVLQIYKLSRTKSVKDLENVVGNEFILDLFRQICKDHKIEFKF